MTIGIASDKDASAPEHEFAPEAFNGWPLFRGGNAGHVPIAGPEDKTPIEVGIDLTPLIEKLGPAKDGEGKIFLRLTRADESEAVGVLHECAVRSYDSKGNFIRESELTIKDGNFGKSLLMIETLIKGLTRK